MARSALIKNVDQLAASNHGAGPAACQQDPGLDVRDVESLLRKAFGAIEDLRAESRDLRDSLDAARREIQAIRDDVSKAGQSSAVTSRQPSKPEGQCQSVPVGTDMGCTGGQPTAPLGETPEPPPYAKTSSASTLTRDPLERWSELRDLLAVKPTVAGQEELAEALAPLDRFYQILVEEWNCKAFPRENIAAWKDTWWLSKLDEALYSDPPFLASSSLGEDTVSGLFGLRNAVRDVQQQRIAQLHAWRVERIEGQPGASRPEARVLEKDSENGPEPTTERHKDGTFCRIVPGRGGYRIDGRVICTTFAVFYQYREA